LKTTRGGRKKKERAQRQRKYWKYASIRDARMGEGKKGKKKGRT